MQITTGPTKQKCTEADVCVKDIKKIQCDIEDFCIYGTACPQEGYSQVVGTYPL